ncbi:MAG: UbiA prenyltransferase family protein [Thermoplasmatota archaeon]
MKIGSTLKSYFRLLRPQGATATAAAILIGALIMGQRDINLLAILFFIGIFSHIYVFVLNEYADINVDQHSHYLQKKPLVMGTISKHQALLIALASLCGAYALTLIFFPSFYPLIILTLSFLLASLYDLFGKKIPAGDLFIAGSCSFICLFGASTVTIKFTPLIFIVACAIFFHILFNNAVEGGLKDVNHDTQAGAKTTAIRSGVKIVDNQLITSPQFIVFSYGVKTTYIALVVLASFQPEINLWHSSERIVYALMVLLIIVMIGSMYMFLNPRLYHRPRLIKMFIVHEIASYVLGPVILIPLLGYKYVAFLLFLPIILFLLINIILYGKPMQPLV